MKRYFVKHSLHIYRPNNPQSKWGYAFLRDQDIHEETSLVVHISRLQIT